MPLNTVRTHLHRGRKHMGELVRARLASLSHPNAAPRYSEHVGTP
jgi:hypothetical protein